VRLGIAAAVVASSLGAALALPEINLVFELIGATTGSFVCFIGPGLLLCRMVPGPLLSGTRLNGLVLVLVGAVFLVLGTYSSVLDVLAQFSGLAPPVDFRCPASLPGSPAS